VLTVTVPKSAEAKSNVRRIAINPMANVLGRPFNRSG